MAGKSGKNGKRVTAKKRKSETRNWVTAQRETNVRLGRIEQTLETSSKVFELMHQRLENLEDGQHALVEGQKALIEGQKLVVERLDRLVDASTRDRTASAERFDALERRVEVLEERDRGPET